MRFTLGAILLFLFNALSLADTTFAVPADSQAPHVNSALKDTIAIKDSSVAIIKDSSR